MRLGTEPPKPHLLSSLSLLRRHGELRAGDPLGASITKPLERLVQVKVCMFQAKASSAGILTPHESSPAGDPGLCAP